MFNSICYEVLFSIDIKEIVKSPIIYAYPKIDVETLHTWEASASIGNKSTFTMTIYDDCFAWSMKLWVANKGVWTSPKGQNIIKLHVVRTDMFVDLYPALSQVYIVWFSTTYT